MPTLARRHAPAPEAPPPALPALERFEDDPGYAAEVQKLSDLSQKLNNLQARRQELAQLIHAAHRDMPGDGGAIDLAAQRLLKGENLEDAPKEKTWQEELSQVERSLDVTRRAVSLQQDTLAALRHRLSERVVRPSIPAHRAAVRKMAEAVAALLLAAQEELDIRNALDAIGASSSTWIPAAAFMPVAYPKDPQNLARIWLAEQVRLGTLSGTEPFFQQLAALAPATTLADRHRQDAALWPGRRGR